MARITITLHGDEVDKLRTLAERDMRGLREQARYLIVMALTAEGNGTQHAPADLAHDKPQQAEVCHA